MLAGLFSCFKGCDVHSKEPSPSTVVDGRRNHARATPASSLRDNATCASTSSSDPTPTRNSLPDKEDTECQRCGPCPPETGTDSSCMLTPTQNVSKDHLDRLLPSTIGVSISPELRSSYCSQAGVTCSPALGAFAQGVACSPALSTFAHGSGRFNDASTRSPTPTMLFALRNLHMALLPTDCAMQLLSPFTTDSPCGGDVRLSSIDFVGLGFGDMTPSDSSDPLSVSGLNPPLRFVNACKLGEEVQDLQLLGRGGYGMVMTGNWRQEGRVAVKVLVSDENKWMESCYKEAVVSKMLAHPNILQTYDFQVAVLTSADVLRAKASWEQQQAAQRAAVLKNQAAEKDPAAAGSETKLPYTDLRADSFELLPQLSSVGAAFSDAAGNGRTGASAAAIDLWQVLFKLGARAGQFVTLIIMEYAEVGTLQRAIAAGAFRESARLSRWGALRSLLVTAKEVAGGMCLLHSYKIIHGDISATNVMLRASRIDKRGFVAKVADFGLSKVLGLSGVARTDDWAGQAQYLAPECLDYEARLASDVFAFGVLLYEMVTGGRAFGEYHPAAILAGRLAGDLHLRWPAGVEAAAPGLRALVEACMQTDPDARPSFREVVEELRRQDAEAKMLHRQHSARRRFTADGLAAPPAAAAAATASGTISSGSFAAGVVGGRMPSLLGPHRFGSGQHTGTTTTAAASAAAVSPGAATVAAAAAVHVGALVAAGGGGSGGGVGVGSAAAGCAPAGAPYSATAGHCCGHGIQLRHSATTGSTGLAAAAGGGGQRRVTASSMVTAGAVVMAAAAAGGVGDAVSDFSAPALHCVSSRTLSYDCCQSEEGSGRVGTAPYGDAALASCATKAPQLLEPIPSGVLYDLAERPGSGGTAAAAAAGAGAASAVPAAASSGPAAGAGMCAVEGR